jgi:dipeptidyl aminopeptidase/acylaminoacyl peptidase
MPAAADVPRVVAQGYDKPPAEVLALLHAPGSASPSLDPTHKTLLIVSQVTYPPMTQVAEPYLKLAGVRVEPRTRRKHDTPGGYGVAPCAQSLTLVDVATSRETPIALPAGGCVDGLQWAASGLRFTFRNTSHDAVELWIGDTTGSVRRLGTSKLNPMLGSTVQWLDDTTLLVKLVPDGASEPPSANTVVVGPSIQETDGKGGEFSTYEARDVLTSKHDEELFEFYGTSQLAVVDVGTGAVTKIGKPAVLSSVDAAPDGDHILVRSIQKPYSYEVTYGRFAHDVEVWDRSGNATTVAKLPVANRVPIHGVPTGPREHEWRPTEPATLVWAEALDGGDWNTKVPARDKVMTASAPFTDSAELTRTETRYGGYDWFEQPARALLTEYDDNRHWRRTSIVDLSNPKAKPVILWDMSSDEQFDDPGSPLYELMANGEYAVRVDGDSIYLTGTGAAPDGVRPFLDKLDLGTRKAVRMFRSEKTAIETVVALADDAKTFLTWRQSPTEVPNCMVRALGASIANAPAGEPVFASEMKPVTHLPDPTPQVRAIKKRVVRYKRKDGTDLSFTLMTPPGYKEGDKVPAILYAYPLDFANKAQAGQNVVSDATFTRLSDYQLLLASGYAIIDDAAFPIIGDPKKAYDTYLEQLVADAQAAVDKAVSLGIDRDRIGVTGHSHGALMTVNLLAHTKLFRAGVATSGSYNKTLTPFGFQSERRSVWKAPKVYEKVSPFFSADKIKLPLLIMHGADDANPGTTPLQAVKLYEAIRGNGGVARLVMLPFEPHWYSAMESNEQLAAEELKWFDAHVKNAPPRKK